MNLSPSIGTPAGRPESGRLDIGRTLQPVIRAIGLTRIARGALLGFAAGALVGAGILAAARIGLLGIPRPAALLSIAVGVLAGIVWGVIRWPEAVEAARAADLYFDLDDRLTTALELQSSATPVARAQRRDTALHIDGLALDRSRGPWLRRREAAGAVAVALLFAVGMALGPPAPARHATPAAARATNTQRVRRAAAKEIQQLRAQLHLGLTPGRQPGAAIRKLDRALSRLRHQLLKAGSTRASLRAVSATQQQLRQLALGLHPINARAVAQLNGSLSRYLAPRPGAGKNPTASRSAAATAQALSRLAQSLAHLSAAQRAALARALARAANATSDTNLRSTLRQAASSLATGNPQAANTALQQAAQSLSQSAAAQAAQSQANTISGQLGAVKNQLTGAGQGSSRQASLSGRSGNGRGAQGAARGRGQGKGQGKGLALGRGQGKGYGRGRGTGVRPGNGTGRGKGRGNGAQQAAATRPGTGTSGARGSGGRGRNGPQNRGHTATVYIPGSQGKGPDVVRNGPSGAPQPGALVPYQEVLGRYVQQAHQALDRASLPPSVQSYVHRYFSTISH